MSASTLLEADGFSLARAGAESDANEDQFAFDCGEGHPEEWADFVAVVADGVGSSHDPATASQLAVDACLASLKNRFTERVEEFAGFDEAQFAQLLREALAQAHQAVLRKASGGSTTAAVVCAQGRWLLAATVGDARAYHYTGGQLRQLTNDQVDRSGDPTDVLGGRTAAPQAEAYARRSLSGGDWIVVCSDGLTKTLSVEDLEAMLRVAPSPAAVARALTKLAHSRNVPDDVTAVVARVTQVGEPFWDATLPGEGSRSPSASGVERSAPPPKASRAAAHISPDRPSRSEGVVPLPQESPEWKNLSADLERRVTRLERNGGSGLSPQELVRIEREFQDVRNAIADVEERQPASRKSSPMVTPGALVAGTLAVLGLVIGLTLGVLLGPKWAPSSRAPEKPLADKPVKAALIYPADYSVALDYQLTDRGVAIRYRTKQGGQKVALFPYGGAGAPATTLVLKAGEETASDSSVSATEVSSRSPGRSSSRPPARVPQ